MTNLLVCLIALLASTSAGGADAERRKRKGEAACHSLL
jgi:hypothetical protein